MSSEDDVTVALRRVEGEKTLQLTTRGRRTGKPHVVTIWFLVDGATLYVMTRDPQVDWVRNVTKTPDVVVEVGGARLRGELRAIADAILDETVRARAAKKYWLGRVGSWFGIGPRRTFRIDRLVFLQ
jgi:deazaflavin-dependent oxidoreductase (nitroreductase family)